QIDGADRAIVVAAIPVRRGDVEHPFFSARHVHVDQTHRVVEAVAGRRPGDDLHTADEGQRDEEGDEDAAHGGLHSTCSLEKSATRPNMAPMRMRRRTRFSRIARSSAITITSSKKRSTAGLRADTSSRAGPWAPCSN